MRVDYDRLDIVFGDPSHNRNLVWHERSHLGRLRLDLYAIYQPTSHRDPTPHIAKLLISEPRSVCDVVRRSAWLVIDHDERAYPTAQERDRAASMLKQDALRRATRAKF